MRVISELLEFRVAVGERKRATYYMPVEDPARPSIRVLHVRQPTL
jgi:hypothetical protein